MAKKDFTIVGLDGKETTLKEGTYEPEMMKSENNATRRAFESAVEGVKGLGKRLKDNVMGTEKQNKEAAESLKRAGYKKGGSVKSASARADGCAIRGKTRA